MDNVLHNSKFKLNLKFKCEQIQQFQFQSNVKLDLGYHWSTKTFVSGIRSSINHQLMHSSLHGVPVCGDLMLLCYFKVGFVKIHPFHSVVLHITLILIHLFQTHHKVDSPLCCTKFRPVLDIFIVNFTIEELNIPARIS